MDRIVCTMSGLFDFAAIDPVVSAASGPTSRIAERNRSMNKIFTEDVHRAGWKLLSAGERLSVPVEGRAVVIGVVLWNGVDRQMLRLAASSLRGWPGVFVVNLDGIRSPADFDAFMPSVPLQTTTPVVAEYEDGVLRRVASGREATGLLTSSIGRG